MLFSFAEEASSVEDRFLRISSTWPGVGMSVTFAPLSCAISPALFGEPVVFSDTASNVSPEATT